MTVFREITKSRLIHLCIAMTFFTSGLIINFIQLILHFCLKPFNTQLYRSLMYYLCFSLYSQLVFVAEWWANSRIEVWIDEKDKKFAGKEHVLLVMNHTYEIDWLAGWMYADKCQVLGNCKAYAKKVISYIPCIGWAWKFAEFVFLERSYDKDREIISRQLQAIMSYPHPVWLLLNAEGTRFTPQKHEASVKFAEERGLPVLKHHLIPRTKGFTASLASLRNKCTIYDINVAFKKDDPVAPTMSNLLNGNGVKAYMFVRRIPLDQVPEDEAKAAEWLQETFREKDRIQDSFHTTGSFFKTSGFKETQSEVQQPRLQVLINYIAWATFSISTILYYLVSSLLSQNWIGLSIAVGVLLTFYVLMSKAIGMSEISKASSYGAENGKKNTN
ncbi:1-acyl-sn-glycerol-3-phosphate acyltransferase gamma-like [Eupeodes corollae]|uniref:1-acyl-sn-glycerol-3-phosphate acyltransferase gamma-like n=1 Tax=Eupeodes corollae TaxID=290404 RepID=UPI002492A56E|nr:1-acyl-sn-glycerol-3-phosphate acyltransferase gamma-like [Eupeodes corollae]XP_055912232.1 1-acyl-sn-glycerol-3-phosphate acyltransferase gamma-like [Eupeodes corollae]